MKTSAAIILAIAAFGALANAVHAQKRAQSRHPRGEPEMEQWFFAQMQTL